MTEQDTTGPETLAAAGWIVAHNGTPGYTTRLHAGVHTVVADEPAAVGGNDEGPTPYDLLLASIGACTAMTLRMYARRKQWPVDEVIVAFRTARSHATDCEECVDHPSAIGALRLERRLELRGALTDEQRARLTAIADRCPVKLALQRGIEIL
ncbi:MAG: OsmC family protein [Gemmatirosa sp.]|nr:OsmC family protein [Gemmatirosa sp.]